jgi:hypothetical protein
MSKTKNMCKEPGKPTVKAGKGMGKKLVHVGKLKRPIPKVAKVRGRKRTARKKY